MDGLDGLNGSNGLEIIDTKKNLEINETQTENLYLWAHYGRPELCREVFAG